MLNYKNILLLSLGATIGGITTYIVTRDKYETIMNEEIEEIRNYYKDKYEKEEQEENTKEEKVVVKEKIDYREIVREYVSNQVDEDDECEDENDDHYTIMESRDLTNGIDFEESKYIESWEFGEQPLYETETIILYSDGVATDDLGDIVDDLDEKIGEDKLRDFIESEDEHLFIRNDILRMDYEIVKDDWKYSELSDK